MTASVAAGAALGALPLLGATGCSPQSPSAAGSGAGASGTGGASGSAGNDWTRALSIDIGSVLPGNTAENIKVEETKDCDVLVLGGGCSGANTAIRAAELGKRVILVEKTTQIGGASNISSGPTAYNTKYAKAAGVETDILPIATKWIADAHWRVDAASIHQLLNKTGEAIDWMSTNGWEFTINPRGGAEALLLPPYDTRDGLFKAAIKKFVEPKGELLTKTTAKQLVVDAGGAVTGALVTDEQGKGIQINAKAVVIATGGYAGNREMVKLVFGFDGVNGGLAQNIGEGLEMAWKAGAQKPQNFGGQMLHQTLARATDAIAQDFEAFPAKYPMILCYVAQLLNVGPTGTRFRNEEMVLSPVASANTSAYQGLCHYVVVSQTIMNTLEKEGLTGINVTRSPGLPPAYKPQFELDTPWKDITKVFDKMVEKGTGFKGDTPRKLAEAAGMDPDIFEKQFNDYESFCAQKLDTQLAKSPDYLLPLGSGPYYIIISEENSLSSWGGLLTNTDYEVLNKDRLPVKGLYAVGNEAGSCLYNDTYVGNGIGMANTITSGYLCGSKLAARV